MTSLIDILKGVSTGLYNTVFLTEEIQKVADNRLTHCINCEWNSTPGKIVNNSKCKACGCFLKLKSKVMSAECGLAEYNRKHKTNFPLKWEAVVDDKIEEQINDLI